MQKFNNKLPAPTRKPNQVDIPEPPMSVTHVYTRQHNKVGLEATYAGPFEIEERPSRSTVKIKVGLTPKGEPRYELRHWKDLRIAHMRPGTEVASRPKRGRPAKKDTSAGSEADLLTEVKSTESGAEFQNGVEASQGELFFGRISIKEKNYLHQIL